MSFQLNTTLPNLFVSQSQLQFPPTEVGEERFLLVKIGQDSVNTPVRVLSESAAFFQVAVQANPLRFGAEATFTPAPGGTFIHVRYAPRQAGRHEGELLIESGQVTQSVALSGHTTGLLSRTLGSSRPGLKIALAAVLLGGSALAYWGVNHRAIVQSWLPRSTQKEPAATPSSATPAQQTVTRTNSLPSETTLASTPKARPTKPKRSTPASPEVATDNLTQPETAPVVRTQPVVAEPVVPVPSRQTVAPPVPQKTATATSAPRPTATTPSAPRPTAERPVTERAATEAPKKRPAPAKSKPAEAPSAESDLEKALNGNQ